MEEIKVTAFQIDIRDNVATVLSPISAGSEIRLLGDTITSTVVAVTEIPMGHKIALQDIAAGEDIIKYGICIGRASKDISKGSWVHLHVMHSVYDERSSHLDVNTGVPMDILYK